MVKVPIAAVLVTVEEDDNFEVLLVAILDFDVVEDLIDEEVADDEDLILLLLLVPEPAQLPGMHWE